MSVWANIVSLAIEYSTHRVRGLDVHRAEFPTARAVLHSFLKTLFLHNIAHGKPIFQHLDAGTHQDPFELRTRLQKVLILEVAAETHDAFDSRPVVPTAIEQDQFARRRQMGDVTLKIPARPFPLGRVRQRDHAADARVENLRDPFDRPSLARCVAAFENDDHPQSFVFDPFLQLDKFNLQPREPPSCSPNS